MWQLLLRPSEDAVTEHVALYQHTKRPEWGFAVVIDHLLDRRIFMFENGESRTISNEYGHLMAEVEPPEEQASKARLALGKLAARAGASTTPKKKAAPRKSKAAKAAPAEKAQ